MTDDPTPVEPPRSRRLRLVLLIALLGAWFLRWTDAQTVLGVARQAGPDRTGAVAALALLAMWGLGATVLVARSGRALAIGAALTDALVAVAATLLVAGEHPWFPGVAALAVLQAVVLAVRGDTAREVAIIRAGAALLAAGALVVGQAWLPVAITIWLGASPLLVLRLADRRLAVDVLFLVAACVALLAPLLNDRLWPGREHEGTYEGAFFWGVACVVLIALVLKDLVERARAEPAGT
jgi:hypothetical protein